MKTRFRNGPIDSLLGVKIRKSNIKKHSFLSIAFVLTIVFLVQSCAVTEPNNSNTDQSDTDPAISQSGSLDVSSDFGDIKIDLYQLTPTSVEIHLVNESDVENETTWIYWFEERNSGEWTKVPLLSTVAKTITPNEQMILWPNPKDPRAYEMGQNQDIALPLPAHEKVVLKEDWSSYLGPLKEGVDYRLVKEFRPSEGTDQPQLYYVEFKIQP